MASTHDTDTDSEDGGAPLDFSSPDENLYPHLSELVDAVTKAEITEATELVALHRCNPDVSKNDALLANMARICRRRPACQLEIGGKRYPPTTDMVEHGYHLRMTLNKLLLAPCVRLECNFVHPLDPDLKHARVYHIIVLEWHFNDYGDIDSSGIRDYVHSGPRISFNCGPATSEGFNVTPRNHGEELEIVDALKAFLDPKRQHSITLHMFSELSAVAESELSMIGERLPGGSGLLLPSIGQVEYAAFSDNVHVQCQNHAMRKPSQLLSGACKLPMVALGASDTFATVKEAAVQLAYSAVIADAEAREALRMFCSVQHRGRLYCDDTFPFVGIWANEFPTLGTKADEVAFRLPKELSVGLSFKHAQRDVRVKAYLCNTPAGLPHHDAYFHVTDQQVEFFGGKSAIDSIPWSITFEVKIDARHLDSTLSYQLDTVQDLQRSANERWHGVLLNQLHSALDSIDLTVPREKGAVLEPSRKEHADRWLMQWMSWNAEQLRVLRSIKAAKGGLVVVMGPAGTGKTALQQALAIYFYMLGFHVLALAPANSNADHLAMELKKVNDREEEQDHRNRISPPLSYCRLYPTAPTVTTEKSMDEEMIVTKIGSNSVDLQQLHELIVALHDYEQDEGTARQFGVAHQVIKAAREGCLNSSLRLRGEGRESTIADPWVIIRRFIEEYDRGCDDREKLLSRHNDAALENYRLAYRGCKGQIIGLNRFMVTTTASVRSRDMITSWYEPETTYGVKRFGVIVFVDEAAKDLEVNVWGGIVSEKWCKSVAGAIFLGDDKQLKPTNTSSQGAVVFNYYSNRLDISLPCRLVRQGFPHVRLVEQRRMHKSISAFANREIYRGKLRDGSGTDAVLDEKLRGFGTVLEEIQANGSPLDDLHLVGMGETSDEQARLHWVQVKGGRRRHPATHSMCVREHVDVFFNVILPPLQKFFIARGMDLREHVMLICAYSYALHEYLDRINLLLAKNPDLNAKDMPRVLTVDASQGQESFMVIFDGSTQHGDAVGFMADEGRANVAITRAREVFWVLGGDMDRICKDKQRPWYINDEQLPLITRYKREMQMKNHCRKYAVV